MVGELINFWSLIKNNIELLWSIDLSRVGYESWYLPVRLGVVILAVILLKMLWNFFKRPRHSHKDAGQFLDDKYSRQGFFGKLRGFMPKILLIPVVVMALLTLAEPFLPEAGEVEEIVQSRIRIDMRDTSTSMENVFYMSTKSKAEAGHDSHLEFIKMRRGQKDRVSFWLFASNPYMIQEFVIDDDELYYLQVHDAPWVTYTGCPIDSTLSFGRVPGNRCINIIGEGGGTEFAGALRMVIK